LQSRGLILLQKNYRCPCGEIDLIMRDGQEVVFVEVRLRRHTYLGSAIESITPAKQRKLIKTALLYLQQKRWLDRVACRFDVLGIDERNELEWIPNAFSGGFF
jgi:putative endonuclease